MKKTMAPLYVETTEDLQIIVGQPVTGDKDHQVYLHAGQVALLIEWLEEASREVERAKSRGNNNHAPRAKARQDDAAAVI